MAGPPGVLLARQYPRRRIVTDGCVRRLCRQELARSLQLATAVIESVHPECGDDSTLAVSSVALAIDQDAHRALDSARGRVELPVLVEAVLHTDRGGKERF